MKSGSTFLSKHFGFAVCRKWLSGMSLESTCVLWVYLQQCPKVVDNNMGLRGRGGHLKGQ